MRRFNPDSGDVDPSRILVRGIRVREERRGDIRDPRTTMPRGGYRFGTSDPRLRPSVPHGQ